MFVTFITYKSIVVALVINVSQTANKSTTIAHTIYFSNDNTYACSNVGADELQPIKTAPHFLKVLSAIMQHRLTTPMAFFMVAFKNSMYKKLHIHKEQNFHKFNSRNDALTLPTLVNQEGVSQQGSERCTRRRDTSCEAMHRKQLGELKLILSFISLTLCIHSTGAKVPYPQLSEHHRFTTLDT